MDLEEAAAAFRAFVAIIRALRTPGTGCPWDLEQDHRTLRPYLVEEAHEVLDAIDQGDDRALREELGDLLLQVVLHAQVADDRGAFAITDVVRDIAAKMVRRHPHVFGSTPVSGAAEVLRNWEQIKAAEKREKGDNPSPTDLFDRIPRSLPALLMAQRYGEKAAQAGTDAPSLTALLDEVRARVAGMIAAVPSATSPAMAACAFTEEHRGRLERDLGDLLFTLCQVGRWLGVNAEDGLRTAARRFAERFDSRRDEVQAEHQQLREVTD